MVPVVRPAGAGDALVADRRHLGRRRPARRRRAGRRLLLRAAEVLRRRRRPVARAAQPRRAASASRELARRRPLDPRVPLAARPRSRTRVKDQTYNTPALATLFLLADQIDWMLGSGGLDWCVARTTRVLRARSTAGPSAAPYATPFVADPAKRSLVVGTIDFDDAVDAAARRRDAARQRHRRHRALPQARAQPAARSAMFPAIEPDDVQALTACIDWVVERIA